MFYYYFFPCRLYYYYSSGDVSCGSHRIIINPKRFLWLVPLSFRTSKRPVILTIRFMIWNDRKTKMKTFGNTNDLESWKYLHSCARTGTSIEGVIILLYRELLHNNNVGRRNGCWGCNLITIYDIILRYSFEFSPDRTYIVNVSNRGNINILLVYSSWFLNRSTFTESVMQIILSLVFESNRHTYIVMCAVQYSKWLQYHKFTTVLYYIHT